MRKNVERKGGFREVGVGIDRTIVVALLVHAAIVAVLARRHVERSKPSAATSWTPGAPCALPESDATETEVTLDDAPAPPPRDGDASGRHGEGVLAARGSVAPRADRGHAVRSWRAPTRTDVVSSPPGAVPVAGVRFGGPVDVPKRVETGLDVFGTRTPLSPTDGAPARPEPSGAPPHGPTQGSAAAVATGAAGEGTGTPTPDVDRAAAASRALALSLRSAAREREHELGLGPEGPVLTALRSATSATTAPVTGRAVFVARANHDGLVTLLELLSCDGAREGWTAAATEAFRALQSKKLRIPSYAKLAEMTIAVSSGWKMPNGHDPGTDVTAMQVPVARGASGKNGTTMDILNVKIDRVRLNRDLTIPVPATRLDVVATNGDSSNLGAKPRRIVHTELLDVKLL